MESTPSSGAFTGATLAEKLNKLNASQQSIETLSHWCIFHRKKAKDIVDTWASNFHGAPKEQRVPFLYLANDILQNSRRKGAEFVNAFWNVLPAVLRDVLDTGDETVRNSALRLVSIWEERRVFGSRGQGLREEFLGKGLQSLKQEARQSPVVHQVFEGTLLERVVKSHQAAQEKSADEYGAFSKCTATLSMVVSLGKEAKNGAAATGDVNTAVAEELLEQELVMRQCIERLESCEKSNSLFCSILKDALFEQENKLELLRAQLQTAQFQLQQTRNVQQRLASGSMIRSNAVDYSVRGASTARFDDEESEHQVQGNQPPSVDSETHISMSSGSATANSTAFAEVPAEPMETGQAPSSTPATSLSQAAEIAAKLTASASSATMLSSVMSSLAAEEASNGLHSHIFGIQRAKKRPRVGNHADQDPSPMPVPYQLPPHLSQFLGSASVLHPGYMYHMGMSPSAPPMQAHIMLAQHSVGPPPPVMPPGWNCLYQFQQSPSPNYSPPPVPAPPTPTPRFCD